MRRATALIWLAGMLAPFAAAAQTVVASPAPDKVSVTIYRAPDRSDPKMNLQWLQGYALITERRTIDIPAGDAVIRFEGVAGGILPESAIVTGLPDGVREKNQDAALLSPRALLAASTMRRVTVRRTSRATGAVREEEAVLRSGPDGAVVMQTAAGFEALKCTGLNETLVYDSVPMGLSAKPTLSVRTESGSATRATVTLSYLADGFDWQANYVAELSADSRSLDLFAWITLANGDETSFVDADTQTVAGKINRDSNRGRLNREPGYVQFRCWPYGNTSTGLPPPAPPPPPVAMFVPMMEMADSIVVTASRVGRGAAMAVQEDLGDLKLYRIPMPVTVASNSQKQVAMIQADRVRADIFYRSRVAGGNAGRPVIMVRLRNRKEDRLGMPLPAGPIAFFQAVGQRPMLLGEGAVADKAVGETLEIAMADATSVSIVRTERDDGPDSEIVTLTASNARSTAVAFEAEIMLDPERRLDKFSGKVVRKDGKILWPVTIPANGTATLTYRSTEVEAPEG